MLSLLRAWRERGWTPIDAASYAQAWECFGGSVATYPVVVERLETIAAKQKIKLQHEAVSGTSGTDTDVIFWTRGGIASALISLPNRYMHSPVEVVSLKDLEQIPQLLAAFVQSVKKGERFKVKI